MNILKLVKILNNFRKDPLAFTTQLRKEQGDRVIFKMPGRKYFILSSNKDITHILKENHENYVKGYATSHLLKFLGRGLILNEGTQWRKQHMLIRPIMSINNVHSLAPIIDKTCQDFISELQDKTDIDVFHTVNRLTWKIIFNTLMTKKIDHEMEDWLEDILFLMNTIVNNTRSLIPKPLWIPTPKNLKFKRIIKKFDRHIYQMITERRNGQKENDFLQFLINSTEEGTAKMSDKEIRDEIMTFLMAGHETVTNTISWTLVELIKNPKYLIEIQSEITKYMKNNDLNSLNSSPYLSAAIDESMRLWPPVWVLRRKAKNDDYIGNFHIPKNSGVIIPVFLSHKDPAFWESPNEFKPERFLNDNKKKAPQGSFYPFGQGPRACIGSYFATIESKIILSHLLYHFNWTLPEIKPQTYEAGVTLRPTNNILMKISYRNVEKMS